jgi:23S rRNA (cytosine1962-C5)-methyltransferase
LFEEAIQRQNHNGRPGDLAVLFHAKGRFLAVGLYDPDSTIRVRILQQGQQATINAAWWQTKIETSVHIRHPLIQSPHTTGYRLVHGENDGLPGLVIDQYDRTIVLKLYTAALLPHLQDILTAVTAVVAPERLVLRLSRTVASQPEWLYGLQDGQVLAGTTWAGEVRFQENGLCFEADVLHGQKTGFFLDQRENRMRVGELVRQGHSVLNVFAYTGGFSLYAARGGADQVTSLDISRPALAAAERNFALNQGNTAVAACHHQLIAGDAFQVLEQMGNDRCFDVVVIDPPAFAKKQAEVTGALTAYGRLTRLGLGVLRRGGTLVIASCSSRVEAEAFFERVHQTAAEMKRPLQEIRRTGQPLDHPATFKEGAYLKCLFAVAP